MTETTQNKERRPQMLILVVVVAALVVSLIVGFVTISSFGKISATQSTSTYQRNGSSALTVPSSMEIGEEELTSDLTAYLTNDLEQLGCSTDGLAVSGLSVDSKDAPEALQSGYVVSEAHGKVMVSYGGQTATVDFTSYYFADDPSASSITWYIYDYQLSSYDIFPEQYKSYMNSGQNGSGDSSGSGSSSSQGRSGSSSSSSSLGQKAIQA